MIVESLKVWTVGPAIFEKISKHKQTNSEPVSEDFKHNKILQRPT